MMKLLAILLATLTLGCAGFSQQCDYEKGYVTDVSVRSFVLGTGETELVSVECADLSYSTIDTGISDNGRETVLGLGELGADAATGGATAGIRKLGD